MAPLARERKCRAGSTRAAARAQAVNSRPSRLAKPILGFAVETPAGIIELDLELQVRLADDGTQSRRTGRAQN